MMNAVIKEKSVFLLLLSLAATGLAGCSSVCFPIKHVDINISINHAHTDSKPASDEEILSIARSARLANPWGETQSLSVVSEWTGFDFTPPAEKITLENGRSIDLTTYRYMTDIAEALYRSDEYELTFRQSRNISGTALYGDHNTYSSVWDEDIAGHSVHCFGNNDTVNVACYDTPDGHFSITYHCAGSDEGLTRADLLQIIRSTCRD